MTQYIEIAAVQSPFDIGSDDNKRMMFSCNYDAMAVAPVTDWERELAKILSDASLGILGTDIFIGTESILPKTGDGPFITIIDTGGSEPESIHNQAAMTYEHLSAQIVVRAKNYDPAKDRALAVWRELDGTYGSTVVA